MQRMSNNMQNTKEEKEIEKLKLHTLREETKNGPKKVKSSSTEDKDRRVPGLKLR